MAAKFGLGKGLAQLSEEMGKTPEISVLAGTERVVVRQISLAQIGANPDQPRKTFDEDELADLAASIREKGVLQPILVRSVYNQPFQYEIVAGERRYRASKMAGLSEIPALVKSLEDKNAMEIALIENVQRENLNPLEESAAYRNLMEKAGYLMSDVSKLIGKSESYIRNLMRLEALPESVKALIKSGQLSASHARTIAVAENPDELAREIVSKKMSVADASSLVKNAARGSKSRVLANNSLPTDTVKKYEKSVSAALGVGVKLKERRGGAGDLVLSFATRMQLEELIQKLTSHKA